MSHSDTSAYPETRPDPIDALIRRVKSEYTELPGLQLTPWQAQRLWALEQAQCDLILSVLVEAAFLRRTRQGAYVRAWESP